MLAEDERCSDPWADERVPCVLLAGRGVVPRRQAAQPVERCCIDGKADLERFYDGLELGLWSTVRGHDVAREALIEDGAAEAHWRPQTLAVRAADEVRVQVAVRILNSLVVSLGGRVSMG